MSKPAVVPQEPGLPCWNLEDVPKAISRIAQMHAERAHYFLASHTPIRNIADDKTHALLNEEDLFGSLLLASHDEVLAVIHGEPGTGKSHLIHWLKLRLDDAVETGELRDIVPVLVRRRDGSLKDALEQLVEQLPASFGHYLQPVRTALSRISHENARQELANELRLELSTRRRARDPLPRHLKDLSEVVASQGFRDWLSRGGGPIDRNVKRLTQASEVEEREALPKFTEGDFRIGDLSLKGNNIPSLLGLIDDLEDEPEWREEAATHFNDVLPEALKEMTGLSGNTLRSVFDQIRADLQLQGKTLAIFIEDVSVMSGLDRDIFNVFEPQARADLCRTIAVLGMTETGVGRLFANEKERVTHMVAVGEGLAEDWRQDPAVVARFTARYLNALRLPEAQVRAVARARRGGGGIPMSACEECPVRKGCHIAFGAVDVDGHAVGLFPLSPIAPQRLFQHLDERSEGVRRNPRGLLMHVMHPVLSARDTLQAREFPRVRLPVRLPEPHYWSGFEREYCGGWSRSQRERLKLLAQAWVRGESAAQTAAALQPLLGPLGFPGFSQEVEVTATPQPHPTPEGPPEEESPTPAPQNEKLNTLLQELSSWMQSGRLERDAEPRELIRKLVVQSVRWEDQRDIPTAIWRAAFKNKDFVDLEGMRTKLRPSRFSIRFDRSEETRNLIEALAQFEYMGGGTWNFPYAEQHKRTIHRWLRRHRARIVESLQPRGLDPARPVRLAVQFLTAAALIQRRAKPPRDADALVAAILEPRAEQSPLTLSEPWRKWTEAIRIHHEEVKAFLLEELSVPQGRTGGINFIDAKPIFKIAAEFLRDPQLETLGEEYFKDFWQTRYTALTKLEELGRLDMVAEVERQAIQDRLRTLQERLEAAEYTASPLPERITAYCADLVRVLQAQEEAGVDIPATEFDQLRRKKVFQERAGAWSRAVAAAQEAVDATDALDVLLFDPAMLEEADASLALAEKYVNALEKLAEDELAHISRAGDPDELAASLLGHLESISSASESAVEPVMA
jgi:hypothetical protein